MLFLQKINEMIDESLKIEVYKNSGEKVFFDFEKLKSALVRSGAKPEQINEAVLEISKKLYNGIKTKEIYKIAYAVLQKKSENIAGRYRLKEAVLDLGPSGYPFEKFVGRLMAKKGYSVEVGKIINGKCVTHEVDVIAINENTKIYIECKFHRDRKQNDVKIPMYIKSRFDDIKAELSKLPENDKFEIKGMIVTNTRFSEDAKSFAKCSGLTLIGWDYPQKNNLRDWIDQSGYHPITSLSTINRRIKQLLLDSDIILCQEIEKNISFLEKLGLTKNEIKKIVREANEVMKY
jgi:hypothetical protein